MWPGCMLITSVKAFSAKGQWTAVIHLYHHESQSWSYKCINTCTIPVYFSTSDLNHYFTTSCGHDCVTLVWCFDQVDATAALEMWDNEVPVGTIDVCTNYNQTARIKSYNLTTDRYHVNMTSRQEYLVKEKCPHSRVGMIIITKVATTMEKVIIVITVQIKFAAGTSRETQLCIFPANSRAAYRSCDLWNHLSPPFSCWDGETNVKFCIVHWSHHRNHQLSNSKAPILWTFSSI